MEGFVTKRGHLITNWKVRWFVLEGGAVKYYQDRTLQKLKGTYFLRPDTVATHHSDMGLNRNVILLFTTSHRFRKRALYFSCDSVETKDAWMTAITKEVEEIKLSGNTHVQAPSENIAGPVDKLGNTLARIFTGEKAEGEESVPVASPTAADEEELQRGRAKQVRPGSSGRDGTVTGEFLDRGRTPQAKSSKQISKMKRLPNSTAAGHQVPINANPVAEAGTLQQDYTAEYDTSDTDNSDGEARGKSQSSTTSTSNSHSSALAADAANSPILQKLKEKHAAAQSADDLSHLQSRVSLPRVSLIAAEEAAQASHKKMNFNNTSAKTAAVNARSRPTVVAEEVNKPSAASTEMHKQPSVTSRGANSSAAVAAETTAKDRRSSGNNSASLPPEQSDNPWIEAYTAEGELYYYHKVSRLARWDKPDEHIAQAVESRMRDIDQAAERSLRERMEAMEKSKQREMETASVKSEKTSEIEKTVVSWARDKQKTDRELSFPELLRDLVYVLPSDLLLIVYDSNHKPVLDALQGFSVNSNPVEVKKAYLRVVRFVHPDKLPPDLDTASKLLVERVFIHLTQKYDTYRKAHDL